MKPRFSGFSDPLETEMHIEFRNFGFNDITKTEILITFFYGTGILESMTYDHIIHISAI